MKKSKFKYYWGIYMQSSSNEITEILKTAWEEIKNSIKNEAGIMDISYKTWIEPLSVYDVEGDTVRILIPSDNGFQLTYIVNHYLDFFKVKISEYLGREIEVSFLLKKDIINNEETSDKDEELSSDSDAVKEVNNENASLANLNSKYF